MEEVGDRIPTQEPERRKLQKIKELNLKIRRGRQL